MMINFARLHPPPPSGQELRPGYFEDPSIRDGETGLDYVARLEDASFEEEDDDGTIAESTVEPRITLREQILTILRTVGPSDLGQIQQYLRATTSTAAVRGQLKKMRRRGLVRAENSKYYIVTGA